MALDLNQTLNGIAYRILNEPADETHQLGGVGSTAKRVYLCKWPDRLNFRENLIGAIYQDASGNNVIIPSHTHPDYKGMFGTTADISPEGRPTGPGQWTYAKVTTTYVARASADPTEYMEESVELCGETSSESSSGWNDASGHPVPGEIAITRSVPFANYKRTYYQIPKLNGPAFAALYGTVNGGVFAGNAVGTALYLGYQASRKWTVGGAQNWTVTHNFAVHPFNHNAEFYQGGWHIVHYGTDATQTKYLNGDFSIF